MVKENDNYVEKDKEKNKEKKVAIEIIINGTSFGELSFPEGISMNGLRAQALEKTNNTGQPPENWEVKDSDGNILDLNKHLCDYNELDQLWFTLKAGIGG
jgi:hypothetical protein